MRVEERDGALWHRLKGMLPPIGTELNCHLDAERRAEIVHPVEALEEGALARS